MLRQYTIYILVNFCTYPLFAQWHQVLSPNTESVQSLYMISDQIGYMSGSEGVFKTYDGGLSWKFAYNASNPEDSQLLAGMNRNVLHFINQEEGYVVGFNPFLQKEVIAHTSNGGETWDVQYERPYSFSYQEGRLMPVSFPSEKTGYVAGLEGKILKTVDGKTWNAVAENLQSSLYTMSFINDTVGFVAGDGIFLKTQDGGTNWEISTINHVIYSLFFHDNQYGFAVTRWGKILSTEDGGSSWSEQSFQNISYYNQIIFADQLTGYIIGGTYNFEGVVLKTLDGGKTWEYQIRNKGNTFVSISIGENKNTVFIGDNRGNIYKTLNGGGKTFPIVQFKAPPSVDRNKYCPDSTYHFTNTGYPSYQYYWLINGQVVSENFHYQVTFEPDSIYHIALVADNGEAKDTATFTAQVDKSINFMVDTLALTYEVDTLCRWDLNQPTVYLSCTITIDHIDKDAIYSLYRNDLFYEGGRIENDKHITWTINHNYDTVTFKVIAEKQNLCSTKSIENSFELQPPKVANPNLMVTIDDTITCTVNYSTNIRVENTEPEFLYGIYDTNTPLQRGNGDTLVFPITSSLDYEGTKRTYQVIVMHPNRCPATPQQTLNQTVSIRRPAIHTYFKLDRSSALVGEEIKITNTSHPFRHVWQVQDGDKVFTYQQDSLPNQIFNSGGTKVITLTSFSETGCSKSKTVYLPVFEKGLANEPLEICWQGDTIASNYEHKIIDHHIDQQGNQYLTGYYTYQRGQYWTSNFFAVKYDSKGNLLWQKLINPEKQPFSYYGISSIGTGITSDESGNAYILGNFGSLQLIFDEDNVILQPQMQAVKSSRGFMIKIDRSGKIEWHILADYRFNRMILSGDIVWIDGKLYSLLHTAAEDFQLISSKGSNVEIRPKEGINGKFYLIKVNKNGIFEKAENFGGPAHGTSSVNLIGPSDIIFSWQAYTPNFRMFLNSRKEIVIAGSYIGSNEPFRLGKFSLSPLPQDKLRYGYVGFTATFDTDLQCKNAFPTFISSRARYGWAIHANELYYTVTQDEENNFYVAANFNDSDEDQYGQPQAPYELRIGSDTILSQASSVVAKYSAEGVLQWFNFNYGVAVKSLSIFNDELYVVGSYGNYCTMESNGFDRYVSNALEYKPTYTHPGFSSQDGKTYGFQPTNGGRQVFIASYSKGGVLGNFQHWGQECDAKGFTAQTDACGGLFISGEKQDGPFLIKGTLTGTCLPSPPMAPVDFLCQIEDNKLKLSSKLDAGLEWYWSVDGKYFSSEKEPLVVVPDSGYYKVCLKWRSLCQEDSICKTVYVECRKPKADFIETNLEQTVQFKNVSSSATSWLWLFGDGHSSTQKDPTHQYDDPGLYQAMLISYNFCQSDTVTKSIRIRDALNENDSIDITPPATGKYYQKIKMSFADKIFGDAPFSLETYSSAGEALLYTLEEGAAELSSDSVVILGAGIVKLRITAPGSNEYYPLDTVVTFRIAKATQEINFEEMPNVRLSDKSLEVKATASSGLPVQYGVKGPAKIIDNNILQLEDVGPVEITASQAGNQNYNAADEVTRKFEILKDNDEVFKFSQKIYINVPRKIEVGQSVKISAVVTSGLEVKLEARGSGILEDELLTAIDTGKIIILAKQEGNALYLPTQTQVIVEVVPNYVTSISEAESTMNKEMVVYPNPVDEKISVEVGGKWVGGKMYMYNTANILISSSKISNSKLYLDVSDLPSGVYYIILVNEISVESNKFIKK